MLNNYFDKIYCINLERRTDRFDVMQKTFQDLNVEVEIVKAIEGNVWDWKSDRYPHSMRGFEGVAGGTSTQIKIIREVMIKKYKSILILEDDCVFADQFNEVFEHKIKYVPHYWDMLYLGGLYNQDGIKPVPIDDNNDFVVRSFDMMSTHAYALHNGVYEKAIDIMTTNSPYLTNSADGFLCTLQKECQAFAFNPPMAWQKANYSDIQHGHRDYVEQFKKKLI